MIGVEEERADGQLPPKPHRDGGKYHPPAVWRVAMIGVIMVFGTEMATQIMLEYISYAYGLSASALKLLTFSLYAMLSLGQVATAFLTDYYFGVVRSLRLATFLGVLALGGLALTASNQTPQLYYAGKSYEVRTVHTAQLPVTYVMVDGQPKSFAVGDDGHFNIVQDKAMSLPARLAPGTWELNMGSSNSGKILLIFPMALLMLTRFFGVALLISTVSRLYGRHHDVRPIGILLLFALLNLAFLLMQLVQLYVEPVLGRRAVLALGAVAMAGAYIWLLKDRRIARIPGKVQRGAPIALRSHAYSITALCFMLISLAMVSGLLNVAPALHVGQGAPMDYAAALAKMKDIVTGIWLVLIGAVLVYSYFRQPRSVFYAALATPVLVLIGLFYLCSFSMRQAYFYTLSSDYVDYGVMAFLKNHLINDVISNPLMVFLLGLSFVLLWPKWRAHLPSFAPVSGIALAMIMAALCYYLLAFGAYQGEEQGLMAWPYQFLATLGLSITELLYFPIISAFTFYLWRASCPTMALAFLASVNHLRGMLVVQIQNNTALHSIDPTNLKSGAAALLQLGDSFAILGGIASVAAALTMAALGPAVLRLARAHVQAGAREEEARALP